MEADWSVEIGGEAPVIDIGWPGWIDLSQDTAQVHSLDEAQAFPPLGQALRIILCDCKLFASTKCDFWMEDFADEAEASGPDAFCSDAENCQRIAGCYIDLLPQQLADWSQLTTVERWVRAFTQTLRRADCPNARVEIVLRQAFFSATTGIGLSLYAYGCGATDATARSALERALKILLEGIRTAPEPGPGTRFPLQ